MHRIIVAKRQRFHYGIQSNDYCTYCDEKDSINHIFSDHVQFEKTLSQEVMNWFNATNRTQFNPTMEGKLFGVTSSHLETKCNKKNLTTPSLFMKNYIYTNKLRTSSILLADFVNKISLKYRIAHIKA